MPKCQRCGKCCRTMVGKDFWKQAIKEVSLVPGIPDKILITDEQINLLPRNEGEGCEMLVDKLCQIHKILGWEYKPKGCRDYPKENKCINAKNRNAV